uniref:Uncharacterized protein n=1 Tax=Siphoviridae sp. cttma3 TaxID=2825708 RepID=A0A8S5V914_9CAUD|nr:MAG TPA: hypothetical protein [Siphoviridae sp. cttma3]
MNPAHNKSQYHELQYTHIWEKIKAIQEPTICGILSSTLKLGDTPNTIMPITEMNTRNRLFSVPASNADGSNKRPEPIMHNPNQNLCVSA